MRVETFSFDQDSGWSLAEQRPTELSFDTTLGVGTTFTLRLPIRGTGGTSRPLGREVS